MARTRASSFVSWNGPESHLDNDMEEDERMVEELLIPSSPVISSSSNSFYKPSPPHFSTPFMPSSPVSSSFQNNHTFPSTHSALSTSMTSSSQPHSDPSSLFTSTDPFYIAQLQASQSFNTSSPHSVFSQNGHISQSSPFAIPVQTQYHHHNHHHHHSSQYSNWDNQPKAMTCTTAF